MELLRDFFLPEMVFLRYALLIGALPRGHLDFLHLVYPPPKFCWQGTLYSGHVRPGRGKPPQDATKNPPLCQGRRGDGSRRGEVCRNG